MANDVPSPSAGEGGPIAEAKCLDCGLPYEDFPLDVILPRPQWLEIHPDEHGLLCAACIVKRARKVPGVTCVHAILEIVPWRPSEGQEVITSGRTLTNAADELARAGAAGAPRLDLPMTRARLDAAVRVAIDRMAKYAGSRKIDIGEFLTDALPYALDDAVRDDAVLQAEAALMAEVVQLTRENADLRAAGAARAPLEARWTATFHTGFGAKIWYNGRPMFQVIAGAEDCAVTADDPKPQWVKCVEALIDTMNRSQGDPATQAGECRCTCCDHGEGSDCACNCHANGACAWHPAAPAGPSPQEA